MGVGSGLYMYYSEKLEIFWYNIVIKRSLSLSHLLMSSCSSTIINRCNQLDQRAVGASGCSSTRLYSNRATVTVFVIV